MITSMIIPCSSGNNSVSSNMMINLWGLLPGCPRWSHVLITIDRYSIKQVKTLFAVQLFSKILINFQRNDYVTAGEI